MRLENLVFDAHEPAVLGCFWAAALGAEPGYQADGAYEARLHVLGGPWLDLCFQRVPERASSGPRVHLDLHGGVEQQVVVDRLLALGAVPLDIGQHDVPWVVLGDPEGNAFCVMEERTAYQDTGPIAAVPVDSSDPLRDAAFWEMLTGWVPVQGAVDHTLRHPSGRGPLLEFCPEREKKRVKNRLHLDVRVEPGEDSADAAERALDLGGSRVAHHWGDDLPWTVMRDPSDNEFCILEAR